VDYNSSTGRGCRDYDYPLQNLIPVYLPMRALARTVVVSPISILRIPNYLWLTTFTAGASRIAIGDPPTSLFGPLPGISFQFAGFPLTSRGAGMGDASGCCQGW
jgi:hypothetical protein